MKIRFKIASTLALIAGLMAGTANADLEIRLRSGNNFVIEDRASTRGAGADNFKSQFAGVGTEISRSTISLKDGDNTNTSAGKLRLFESNGNASGGVINSITLKAPDTLAADRTMILPGTLGSPGQVLIAIGKGKTSWK